RKEIVMLWLHQGGFATPPCRLIHVSHTREVSFPVPMRSWTTGTGDRACWKVGRACEKGQTRDAAPSGQDPQELIRRAMQALRASVAWASVVCWRASHLTSIGELLSTRTVEHLHQGARQAGENPGPW